MLMLLSALSYSHSILSFLIKSMAGSSMSPEYDVIAMALPDLLDDTNFDHSPDLPIKEEMIMEVMQELYNEIINNNNSNTTSPPPPQPERVFTPTKGGEAVVGGEIGGAAVVKESASETAVIMEVEDQEGDVEEWVSELLEGRNGAELRDEWMRRWVPQQS